MINFADILDKKNRWGLVAILAILLCSILFTCWIIYRADREIRNDLLIRTKISAESLEFERVKALTAAKENFNTPNYNYLNQQLLRIRKINEKCSYIYLMTRPKSGKVLYLLDADTGNDPDDPPIMPGEVYTEASDELRNIFDTAEAFVEGPLPDEWGVWVSAIIPIVDPETGELIAVLGMDLDARTWKINIAEKVFLPLCLMLSGVILLATVIFVPIFQVKATAKPVHTPLMGALTITLFFLTGGFGSIIINMQQNDINLSSKKTLINISKNMDILIKRQSNTLNTMGEVIISEKGLVKALKTQNREKLYSSLKDRFISIKKISKSPDFLFFYQTG